MLLYHYYEQSIGPMRSLSDLPMQEAKMVMDDIRARGNTYAASRFTGYLERRAELERIVRKQFVEQGGNPQRNTPHYFVVEECPWLETWYSSAQHISIPIDVLDTGCVSFTYGDMFPTFSERVQDGKEYRRRVYSYSEIITIIQRYGLPQVWNQTGTYGPERYFEAQVWCDIPQQ